MTFKIQLIYVETFDSLIITENLVKCPCSERFRSILKTYLNFLLNQNNDIPTILRMRYVITRSVTLCQQSNNAFHLPPFCTYSKKPEKLLTFRVNLCILSFQLFNTSRNPTLPQSVQYVFVS